MNTMDAPDGNTELLIRLRDEVYAGSWEKMAVDLEERLARKPYIFRLTERIKEDLHCIRELMKGGRDREFTN